MDAMIAGRDIDEQHVRWRERLPELLARNDVPGAALGVLHLDPRSGVERRFTVAAGVLNLTTGVAATTDSLFQIGSITKVWTATLVMQLVDQGVLDLDAPLVECLPELDLREGLAKRATVRHLLTHTSGLDGDLLTDTGRGDDCLERYVRLLADGGINHPLGATFSYCNAGFVIAGRIVERLTEQTWDAAIRTRIAEPLALTQTFTLPEECMLGRFAVGHVGEAGEAPHVASSWTLPRSLGPAGLITCTVDDLLTFVAMHLRGGRAADGRSVLAAETGTAMQAHHADLPDRYTLGDSWGLGWIRMGWDGRRVIGHDGNTIGQDAYLRLIPDLGLAVTLLTNGGESGAVFRAAVTELFADLGGVAVPPPLEPRLDVPLGDVEPYLGRYRRTSLDTDVYIDGDRFMLRTTATGDLADLEENPVHDYELRPTGEDGVFAFRDEGATRWTPTVFYRLPDGSPYVHFSARANPWVGR